MLGAILPGLISGGLSMLSGISSAKQAAKQSRLQYIQEETAHIKNNRRIQKANKANKKLGRELLATPMVTEEQSHVDVAGMMAAAEASGINPITFVRNGGLQAYAGSKQTVTGHNAAAAFQLMSPQVYTRGASTAPHSANIGGAVANGLSDGFNAFMDVVNRNQTQQFQKELLGMQLDAVQRSGFKGSRSFSVPTMKTSGSISTTKMVGGLAGMPGDISVGDREWTNPFPTGTNLKVDPTVPNAEQAETRYGDILQELFGGFNLLNDMRYTMTGKTLAQQKADFIGHFSPEAKAQRRARTMDRFRSIQEYTGGLGTDAANWLYDMLK